MAPLRVSAGAWSHQPVLAALSTGQRRTGLRPMTLGWGLLLAGRSVHGSGMREPLSVVAIDAGGSVLGHAHLPAGGWVVLPDAFAVLELPATVGVPPVGASLRWATVPT